MHAAAIDWLTDLALGALQRGERIGPEALALLLRRYADTGREDLGDAVGLELARALDEVNGPTRTPEWLGVFVDAASLSDDDRLGRAAADLAHELRGAWPCEGTVRSGMRSLDVCLRSLAVVDQPGLMAAAIDEMERLVGLAYRPGAGVRHAAGNPADGDLTDHTDAARALLTAHTITGRLPYAMLADDLMQFARRRWWDDERGGFSDDGSPESGARSLSMFVSNCEAARVCCHLAALHHDPAYRQAAVMVDGCDYAADCARTLARVEPSLREHGVAGAVYGLALGELHALR